MLQIKRNSVQGNRVKTNKRVQRSPLIPEFNELNYSPYLANPEDPMSDTRSPNKNKRTRN